MTTPRNTKRETTAGREVDAEIAEKVMGRDARWRLIRAARGDYRELDGAVPRYSTEIVAAWLVVEALVARDMRVVVRTHAAIGDGARVELFGRHAKGAAWMVHGEGVTVPLAICLAALEAVKVQP